MGSGIGAGGAGEAGFSLFKEHLGRSFKLASCGLCILYYMKVIVSLKLKVDTTYYAGRSIYNNLTGGVFEEPGCLTELESIVWLSRTSLELELRNQRLRIPDIMKIYISREDLNHSNKLTVLYPEIGVKPLGPLPDNIIEYIENPQNPTPKSNQVMNDWRLRKWFETKDPTYLGLPAPIDYNTMFNIKEVDWSHFKGI
ncbi:MAG: hypothetical protein JRN02_02955 [Nitrososphaerota archaeon]|nr:hypothetical protein [Nitrososphaerota archaeon]